MLTRVNFSQEMKNLYRHLFPNAPNPGTYPSHARYEAEVHRRMGESLGYQGGSFNGSRRLQAEFEILHKSVFSKSGGMRIPDNQKALSGYALACAATGSHLDDMPAARSALETMELAHATLHRGVANHPSDLIKSKGKLYARTFGQASLYMPLNQAVSKKLTGRPLDRESQLLLNCWPEGRFEEMLSRLGPTEFRKYAQQVIRAAMGGLAQTGTCGELTALTLLHHSEKIRPDQAMTAVSSRVTDHIWPEITPANGDRKADNLILESWAQDKGFMTPIQREHGHFTAKGQSQVPKLTLSRQLGIEAAEDARQLQENIDSNRGAMDIFRKTVKEHSSSSREMAKEMAKTIRGTDPSELRSKSIQGINLEIPHPLDGDFRNHAARSIARLNSDRMGGIKSSFVARQFGASVHESTRANHQPLIASAQEFLNDKPDRASQIASKPTFIDRIKSKLPSIGKNADNK